MRATSMLLQTGLALCFVICCGLRLGSGRAAEPAAAPSGDFIEVPGATLRRSAAAGGGGSSHGNYDDRAKGSFRRRSLVEVLSSTAGLDRPSPRMFGAELLPDGLFDAVYDVPAADGPRAPFRAVADACEQAFGLKIVWEEREIDGLVLRKGPRWDRDAPPRRPRDDGDSTSFQSVVVGFGPNALRDFEYQGDVGGFAKRLEGLLKTPVFDETGSIRRFDLHWRCRPRTAQADLMAFCALHGFELAPAKRKTTAVFIEAWKPKGAAEADLRRGE